MYIDKFADIVNKYNKKYHSTIKMKPVDVNSSKIQPVEAHILILIKKIK